MITSLVAMYEKGAITADHLVAQCIHMIDPDDPGLVLSDLPNSILDRMLVYARRYQPDRMVSNYGNLPTSDQVEAAKNWIEDLQTIREGGKTTTEADWYQYEMEERIVEILKSFAAPSGVNQYSLTIYQIAIEFAKRYEPDFNRMGRPLGGAGAGNRALTVYMANQLSKRIKAEKIDQIEMQFLHPADTESLIYKYNNTIIATTPASGYPIPVYRLRQVPGQRCQEPFLDPQEMTLCPDGRPKKQHNGSSISSGDTILIFSELGVVSPELCRLLPYGGKGADC